MGSLVGGSVAAVGAAVVVGADDGVPVVGTTVGTCVGLEVGASVGLEVGL